MNSASDILFGWIAALIFLGSAWFLSDWVPFRSEVTVYRISCLEERQDGLCPVSSTLSYTLTFRADAAQQSVVYWSDHGSPSKFHNCAIRDAMNWKCTSKQPLPDIDHEMIDGEFSEYNSLTREPLPGGRRTIKVPKWKWWALWAREKVST